MTAAELIRQSLLEVRAIGIGQALADEQAQDALVRFNSMIAEMSSHDLLVPFRTRETLTLTIGTNPHTIGVGGTLNTAQPMDIHEAVVRRSDVDFRLEPMPVGEYADVVSKAVAGQPTRYYFERGLSLGSLYFDYVPDAADSLILSSLKPITGFALLTTEDSVPNEYERLFMLGLAIELGPSYGKEPKTATVIGFENSLNNLKRNNAASRVGKARYPAELRPGSGRYNIETGDE